MAATVWKGHLTFGLVSIPVRLYKAARAEKVSLHQLHRAQRAEAPRIAAASPVAPSQPQPQPQNQPLEAEAPAPVSRIRQTILDPVENTPIPRSELVRGYEYAKNQYVVLEEEDIRKITPQTATEMQIVEFVRFSDIDPIYLETSYYMAPDKAGEKAYALLFEGMRESGYVALAQVAMHRREHVMILRPGKTGIVTHTMFYPDEVRTIQEFRTDVSLVTPKEMGLAKMLIDTLAEPFEPSKFKDAYRERLNALSKPRCRVGKLRPSCRSPPKVVEHHGGSEKESGRGRAQGARYRRGTSAGKEAKSERPAAKKQRSRA